MASKVVIVLIRRGAARAPSHLDYTNCQDQPAAPIVCSPVLFYRFGPSPCRSQIDSFILVILAMGGGGIYRSDMMGLWRVSKATSKVKRDGRKDLTAESVNRAIL